MSDAGDRISQLRIDLHRLMVAVSRHRETARQYRDRPETRHPDPNIAEMFAEVRDRWADRYEEQAHGVRRRLAHLLQVRPEDVAMECPDHGIYVVDQCPGCAFAVYFPEAQSLVENAAKSA